MKSSVHARQATRALALLVLAGCATHAPAPAPTSPAPAPVAAADTVHRAPAPMDARAFAPYVGQYAAPDAPEMILSIFADSGRFWMQPTDNPRFELVPA